MPRFPVQLTPEGGVIEVQVGAPDAYATGGDPLKPGLALVDTGAQMSAISQPLVAATKPPAFGAEWVARVGGEGSWRATYLVRIRFDCLGVTSRWFEIEAVEVEPASPGVDFIIGRDLLRRMVLNWDGPEGTASLAV